MQESPGNNFRSFAQGVACARGGFPVLENLDPVRGDSALILFKREHTAGRGFRNRKFGDPANCYQFVAYIDNKMLDEHRHQVT